MGYQEAYMIQTLKNRSDIGSQKRGGRGKSRDERQRVRKGGRRVGRGESKRMELSTTNNGKTWSPVKRQVIGQSFNFKVVRGK